MSLAQSVRSKHPGQSIQAVIKRVEHARFLDSVAVPLARAGHWLVRPRAVRNLLSGTGLGHPAHPPLTDVPIGAWTAATLLDTVGGKRGAPFAHMFVGLGMAAAVPTALAGLNDWSDTQGEPGPRRVGVVHAAANATALALFTSSFVARCRGMSCKGRMLGYAGYAALLAGSHLGGHLAFTNAVNVNRNAWEDRPLEWTSVLADSDLTEDAPVKVMAGAASVLLYRRAGVVYAVDETCSHMGGPLSEGRIEDGCVVCPWHGSTFDPVDGRVVRGPATAPLPTYETRIHDGRIEVRAVDSGRGPLVG